GESIVKGLEGAIEADSWSWGIENPTALLDGRYAGVKANFGKLTFVHSIDRASPALMQHCASGKIITDVRLSQARPTTYGPSIFLQIDLKNVIVNEVALSGAAPADIPTKENVSLTYSEIKVTYTQMQKDGSKVGDMMFQWNVA
ncbi:MAG: type VI secretion system tube protein Hcp, partial [Phycisphaerae bacterium]|nr:type VI secretion system tube protein Hcp [Phycisphaerae bacterium]NIP55103.1 type VI secretion system tube protein Hcp [Phycisphaerae bacterium]NIX31271.1 hypothetical protein [Phycisphaerae bacterium]